MFSGAVKIGDLNDFIAPSQACVVNIGASKQAQDEVGTVQLQPRAAAAKASLQPQLQPQLQPPSADPVKISLHDCLACSGCVTSAETVLLQQQSTAELEAKLADPGTTVAITLSPQSVTSLAVLFGLTPRDAAARLAAALRGLGAAAVFDLSAARSVALLETAAEFVHRYRLSQRGATELASAGVGGIDGGENGEGMAAAAAAAAGAADGLPPADQQQQQQQQAGGMNGISSFSSGSQRPSSGPQPLPMLASACPGWVCYAEKTHGTFVLPHISTARSPQAVAGALVKRGWCAAAGVPPAQVFHCAVMPCYDKKLEASREDFYLPGSQVPETDCVLATVELLELLQKHGIDLAAGPPPPGPPGRPPFDSPLGPAGKSLPWGAELAGVPGGSGGYLEFVFRFAAQELFGRELPPGRLQMTVGRNADFLECSLEVGGRRVLRFASAYGFRNIQGLMRKIKTGRCEYDYVEIMACPSGCLNGGGQLRPQPGETPAALLERLELAYHSQEGRGGLALRWPQDCQQTRQVYERLAPAGVGSQAARELFHTQYHQREKSVTATLGDW